MRVDRESVHIYRLDVFVENDRKNKQKFLFDTRPYIKSLWRLLGFIEVKMDYFNWIKTKKNSFSARSDESSASNGFGYV